MGQVVRRCAWGLLLSVLFFAQSGLAVTDQERSAARDAARAGVVEFRKGNFEDALRLLETAERVVHAPTHLLYIARSQAKSGLLVEARETYQKLINEKLPDGAAQPFVDAQEVGQTELAELSGRIPQLKVTLVAADGRSLDDPVLAIDEQIISSVLVGLNVPANPGRHVVTARAPGMREARAEVNLVEGAKEELQLTLVVDDTAPAPTSTPQEPPETSDSTGMTGRRKAGWILAGSGAAVLAGGAVLGILSHQQVKSARGDDALCSDDTCTDDGWTEVNQAKTKALIADIGMGVGLAAVGVGMYLIITGKRSTPTETGALRHVIPYIDRHGGHLTFQGGF